uniref:Uncharacterized protein n=1 Tax=Anguilla anguilla TaxID=7936 RepID=A0A0E9UC64_ANGAN
MVKVQCTYSHNLIGTDNDYLNWVQMKLKKSILGTH